MKKGHGKYRYNNVYFGVINALNRKNLTGELVSAEALTEPRGGSDFFWATTMAKLKGDYFTVKGQKRFVVAASGADFFVVYCKTDPEGRGGEGGASRYALCALRIFIFPKMILAKI